MRPESDTLIVIPARYNSTRFPGKPLALLHGKTIISRVCLKVQNSGFPFIVATDSELIAEEVRAHGWDAVMTSDDLSSGTERVAEAVKKISTTADIIVNIQGDEPFIAPEQIKSVVEMCKEPGVEIATLARVAPHDWDNSMLLDPNIVKVERAISGRALNFSRSVIPYIRKLPNKGEPNNTRRKMKYDYLLHVGIYAFRRKVLENIVELPATPIEMAEQLEQMRWMEWGIPIQVGITKNAGIGIDTPEDLRRAEELLKLFQYTQYR